MTKCKVCGRDLEWTYIKRNMCIGCWLKKDKQ